VWARPVVRDECVETSSTEPFDPVQAKEKFEAHMQCKADGKDTEQPDAEVADGKDTEQPNAEVADGKDTEQPDAEVANEKDTEQPDAALQARIRLRADWLTISFDKLRFKHSRWGC
jgi:hypothetical protein